MIIGHGMIEVVLGTGIPHFFDAIECGFTPFTLSYKFKKEIRKNVEA